MCVTVGAGSRDSVANETSLTPTAWQRPRPSSQSARKTRARTRARATSRAFRPTATRAHVETVSLVDTVNREPISRDLVRPPPARTWACVPLADQGKATLAGV